MAAPSTDVLLIGGGHAHVAVLADWIRNGIPVRSATLLTPDPTLRYSGMVPGWISGEHPRDEGLVDLVKLTDAAGVEIVLDACVALDPEARSVLTRNSGVLSFTCASINSGGIGRASRVLGADPRIIDVRPISRFVEELATRTGQAKTIAVVGAGAGGVELAFALRNRDNGAQPEICVIAGDDGLVPDFSGPVRRRIRAEMVRQSIAVIAHDARLEDGKLLAGNQEIKADFIVAALGTGAPDWPRQSGLACDEEGFIAVDRHQRSLSHPRIFAVGDIASRSDRELPRSGVHAVFAGPILAHNLREVAAGREASHIYRPRRQNLYLISTGRGEAIASYGPLAAQGKWVSRLKAWIDKRWIATYAKLAMRS